MYYSTKSMNFIKKQIQIQTSITLEFSEYYKDITTNFKNYDVIQFQILPEVKTVKTLKEYCDAASKLAKYNYTLDYVYSKLNISMYEYNTDLSYLFILNLESRFTKISSNYLEFKVISDSNIKELYNHILEEFDEGEINKIESHFKKDKYLFDLYLSYVNYISYSSKNLDVLYGNLFSENKKWTGFKLSKIPKLTNLTISRLYSKISRIEFSVTGGNVRGGGTLQKFKPLIDHLKSQGIGLHIETKGKIVQHDLSRSRDVNKLDKNVSRYMHVKSLDGVNYDVLSNYNGDILLKYPSVYQESKISTIQTYYNKNITSKINLKRQPVTYINQRVDIFLKITNIITTTMHEWLWKSHSIYEMYKRINNEESVLTIFYAVKKLFIEELSLGSHVEMPSVLFTDLYPICENIINMLNKKILSNFLDFTRKLSVEVLLYSWIEVTVRDFIMGKQVIESVLIKQANLS